MRQQISLAEMSTVCQRAIASKQFDSVDSAVVFYDLSRLSERVTELKHAFPQDALHAVAAKANPLLSVLGRFRDWGTGVEVASLPELQIAESIGFIPSKIVFDSPAKTIEELAYALRLGVRVNLDSFSEVDRLEQCLAGHRCDSSVGLRLNPQVGTGKIGYTSTAGEYSKFGIPLSENRDRIIEAFKRLPWLRSLHVHVGSQGCPVRLIVEGVKVIVDFALELNQQLARENTPHHVEVIDIGGGLPVPYRRDIAGPTMGEYSSELKKACPALFDGTFKVITEFGRFINANAGWTLSRVEYVKTQKGIATAIIHVGAEQFVRKCYNPNDWHHDLFVLDRNGKQKEGNEREYAIAGPLCFSGDLLAASTRLPEIEEGDYVAICDTGAYTLSMWSRYNSRHVPKVIGYTNNGESFEILKKRESFEDIKRFWS